MAYQPSASVKTDKYKNANKKALVKQNINNMMRDAIQFQKQLEEVGEYDLMEKMRNIKGIIVEIYDSL